MAGEVLSIELQAKVDQFVAGLLAAANQTKTTGNSVELMTASISKNMANVNKINLNAFNASLKAGQISIKGFENAAKTIPNALPKITAGSAQAANALTNLGRVAQDAPFGFIGIQNNLNPLLESFQRLRAEAGSNSAALKALGQSLIGPAGIGIALSLVSSAILLYQSYQQKANKATTDAKKNTDDYVNSLGQLEQVQVKGAQNAQREVTELQTLYGITQNTTLSVKQRTGAVDELQKKYPDYFKNIKDETVLNGGAKDAYDRLTTSIIATARARAAQDLITKNSSRQLENEQKLIDLEAESNKLSLQSAKLRKDAEDEIGGTRDLLLNKAIGAEAKRLEIYKLQNNLKTDSNLIDGKNLKLTEAINEQIKKGADLTSGTGAATTEKGFKSLSDILKDLDKALEVTNVQFQSTFGERNEAQIKAYQSAIDAATKSFGAQSKAVQDLISAQQRLFQLPSIATGSTNVGGLAPINTSKVTGKEDTSLGANLSDASKELGVRYAEILQQQDKFNEEFKKGFENLQSTSIAEAIGGGFSAIGEAMVSGGNIIEAAGSALMGTLSQFLNELGGMLVKKGLATVLAGTALNFLFPGSGAKTTAGGFALIAAGAALSLGSGVISGIGGKGTSSTNNNSNVTAFANGGIISGPTLGLMGEYSGAKTNPEVVAPLNKLKSMLGDSTPQFEVIQYIEGDRLAVMVRNANKRLNRI